MRMNIENLTKMLEYLKKGDLLADFTMRSYSRSSYDDQCNSCGCIIGHASLVIKPRQLGVGWLSYSENLFGIDGYTQAWEFLFASDWANPSHGYDYDSSEEAALRIEFFLANSDHEFFKSEARPFSEVIAFWEKNRPAQLNEQAPIQM